MLKNRNNNQVIDNNQVISFRLVRSEDGTFTITKREAMNRTKHMIAFDKKLNWNDVAVGKKLEDDLKYTEEDKGALKGLIKNIFFRDIDLAIDSDELSKASTLGELSEIIWKNYAQKSETDESIEGDKSAKATISRNIQARKAKSTHKCLDKNGQIESTEKLLICPTWVSSSHKISHKEIDIVTKCLIHYHKGLPLKTITYKKNLREDLKYENNEEVMSIMDLIIKPGCLKKFIGEIDRRLLEKAKTVQDVSDTIWNNYIQNKFKRQ